MMSREMILITEGLDGVAVNRVTTNRVAVGSNSLDVVVSIMNSNRFYFCC